MSHRTPCEVNFFGELQGLVMTLISLPVGTGGTLSGDYFLGTHEPNFAVLWVHGFGSHRGGEKALAVREECARQGWSFAAFDFRGHGGSSGTMHELRASHLLEDLSIIRDWLRDTRGHTRLGLVASSMGAFAAAWFASQNVETVLGCVLLAPAFGFLDRRWARLTDAQIAEWKRTDSLHVKTEWVETDLGYGLVEERDRFRVKDLIHAWRTPLLMIHGAQDDVIPCGESLAFLNDAAYPGIELRLLKAGDHRLTTFKDDIAAGVSRFFHQLFRT